MYSAVVFSPEAKSSKLMSGVLSLIAFPFLATMNFLKAKSFCLFKTSISSETLTCSLVITVTGWYTTFAAVQIEALVS